MFSPPVLSPVTPADNSIVRSSAFSGDLHFNRLLSYLEDLAMDHQCAVRACVACPVFKRLAITTKTIETTREKVFLRSLSRFFWKIKELVILRLHSEMQWSAGTAQKVSALQGCGVSRLPQSPPLLIASLTKRSNQLPLISVWAIILLRLQKLFLNAQRSTSSENIKCRPKRLILFSYTKHALLIYMPWMNHTDTKCVAQL